MKAVPSAQKQYFVGPIIHAIRVMTKRIMQIETLNCEKNEILKK